MCVHHSKPVKAWVVEREKKSEVFYLPSDSPELNPALKHAIRTKAPARTKIKLRDVTTEHMTLLASSPERVKAYFQDPYVKYAAS